MNRPPSLLFGIPIADVTMAETVDLIGDLVQRGRHDGHTFQIATVNVDFLVNAIDDSEIHATLQGADVCLADGTPVVWAARLLGMPLRERVAGSDLLPELVARSESTGWRIHVLGSAPAVAERAVAMMRSRYPAAAFTVDPGPIIDDPADVDPATIESIVRAAPDILCVALGNPKQERFIAAYRERLGVPVLIGVGGSLDMFTGERKRAPRWVQRIGFEWVVRALQEPRRLGPRYLHDIRVFGPRLASVWRASRRRRRHGAIELALTPSEVTVTCAPVGAPGGASWSDAVAHLDTGAALHIGPPTRLGDAAAAQLVGLLQHARAHHIAVHAPSAAELAAALDGIGVSWTTLRS
ncbi:MAG TPA: WecB/TagA/CpsF family glycosyltransferase [Ilumatobacter sp.]|nr:WecB/TagA/CpsF family glycosyltransferase [Ilumatobacter sp.]